MYKNIELIEDGVRVVDTNLILAGKDTRTHLNYSTECILMAITLGNDIEKTRLYKKINLIKALILDACATTAVEEVCDIVKNKIKK